MVTQLPAPSSPVADSGLRVPRLVGADHQVPLATGQTRRFINLDHAASTPAMEPAAEAVYAFLPWYSSVHRGSGYTSVVSSNAYESARAAIATFVGARPTDHVIFVRNTTDAINLVAHCLTLRPGHVVLSTAVEHHADMLPWRRIAKVRVLDPPESPDQLLQDAERAFSDPLQPVGLLAVTGAGNVTGEVFPIQALARMAHEHGALVLVDGAQLVPHRPVDMVALGIDFLVCSGHKMYAPFGAGAVVGPAAVFDAAEPMLAGGGAVVYVTLDDVEWAAPPERHEAGSPNVVGAVAMGAAANVLRSCGMENIANHERRMLAYLEGQLDSLPRVRRLRLWEGEDVDRVGICTFTVTGMHHALVAAALSAEHGVGVRHGCFCAHPYITHLLGIGIEDAVRIRADLRRGEHGGVPGAVRASMGIATTVSDIDRFTAALRALVEDGPRLSYRQDPHTGDFIPETSPLPLPPLPYLPYAASTAQPASGCGRF